MEKFNSIISFEVVDSYLGKNLFNFVPPFENFTTRIAKVELFDDITYFPISIIIDTIFNMMPVKPNMQIVMPIQNFMLLYNSMFSNVQS